MNLIKKKTLVLDDTLSFGEALSKREPETMPPPDPPLISPSVYKSMKESIVTLKRNLTLTSINAKENNYLKEELNKVLIASQSGRNNNNETFIFCTEFSDTFNIQNNSLLLKEDTNYNIEKLKINLNSKSSTTSLITKERKESISLGKVKSEATLKYTKFPPPRTKKEFNLFCNNLLKSINSILNHELKDLKENDEKLEKIKDELYILKIQVEVRYNDYKNRGLYEAYFREILMKSQQKFTEVFDRICRLLDKEPKFFSKKYAFIGNKRNRSPERRPSLSEMKSVTSGSGTVYE